MQRRTKRGYEAWDDGTYSYRRSYTQSDLPMPFVIYADGSESTANKHFDKGVMVIERVGRKLMLLKGTSVVCVHNGNPIVLTPQQTSGAAQPGAQRVVRQGMAMWSTLQSTTRAGALQ